MLVLQKTSLSLLGFNVTRFWLKLVAIDLVTFNISRLDFYRLLISSLQVQVSKSEALVNWRAWIQLAENVTCCVPVAAAPSQLDLLPHKQDNQLQSYFRWFMELPFVSQDEEVRCRTKSAMT